MMSNNIKDTKWSLDAIGERAEQFYAESLRDILETEENIGRLLLIDTETNRYVIGDNSREMARHLGVSHPEAVYMIRIGYPAAVAIGNTLRPFRDMSAEEAESWHQRIRRSKSAQ
jgi:hypothetical protein